MALPTSDEIVRLSVSERLALISQLWDSLDDNQVSLTVAQREELDQRLDSFDQDLEDTVTWAELRTELEQRSR